MRVIEKIQNISKVPRRNNSAEQVKIFEISEKCQELEKCQKIVNSSQKY